MGRQPLPVLSARVSGKPLSLRVYVDTRLNVKVSGQDLLHTNRFNGSSQVPGFRTNTRLTFDTRLVLLNLTYSVGNQQLKSERQRRTASDDETKRAN